MQNTLPILIERLNDPEIKKANIIDWGSPVPSFGDLSRSKIATLGLNPSNREFVDIKGKELNGEERRFHTLNSLNISEWSDIDDSHLEMISDSCRKYFHRNPYDGWFKSLDLIISGTSMSYYCDSKKACHLDLIPYATKNKWTSLSSKQRALLLELAGDTLALLLKESPIKYLILNGMTVIKELETVSGVSFNKREMPSWALPRKSGKEVKGYSYTGAINQISGVKLRRNIKILGYNHNIQSSFGVTTKVKNSIRNWVARRVNEGI
jgi:hypothetical protein